MQELRIVWTMLWSCSQALLYVRGGEHLCILELSETAPVALLTFRALVRFVMHCSHAPAHPNAILIAIGMCQGVASIALRCVFQWWRL